MSWSPNANWWRKNAKEAGGITSLVLSQTHEANFFLSMLLVPSDPFPEITVDEVAFQRGERAVKILASITGEPNDRESCAAFVFLGFRYPGFIRKIGYVALTEPENMALATAEIDDHIDHLRQGYPELGK
jgi:hypothetical protein